MLENHIHAYEQLSLSTAGIVMGIVLIILHALIILQPKGAKALVASAIESPRAGQVLLGVDALWFMLLLLNGEWNGLRMELFSFEPLRGLLLVLTPVIWVIFSVAIKENLFARALGIFILLLAIVPMTAAFLKDPATRVLIPLWWYPMITLSLFWVAKPYLFRDWFNALMLRPRLCKCINAAGLLYAVILLGCAIIYW